VGEMGEDRPVGSKHQTGPLRPWLRMVVKSRSQQKIPNSNWFLDGVNRGGAIVGEMGEDCPVGTQDWPSGNEIENSG
jgi:hypothetical protein